MANGPLDTRGPVRLNQGGAHRQIRIRTPPARPSLARDAELRAATAATPEPPSPPAKPLEPLSPRRGRREPRE